MKAKVMYLSVNQCPVHKDYWSISVDDDNGGVRVTPSKCCGQWKILKRWPITRQLKENILEEIGNVEI